MSNNGDLPAMPIELNGFGQFEPVAYIGLTKREQFAMAAMQGLCANQYLHRSHESLAISAVAHADANSASKASAK